MLSYAWQNLWLIQGLLIISTTPRIGKTTVAELQYENNAVMDFVSVLYRLAVSDPPHWTEPRISLPASRQSIGNTANGKSTASASVTCCV